MIVLVVIIFIPFLPTQRMLDIHQLRPYERLRPEIPSTTSTLHILNFQAIVVALTWLSRPSVSFFCHELDRFSGRRGETCAPAKFVSTCILAIALCLNKVLIPRS